MEQPILDGLLQYNTEGCYPWHMPGHKRRLNTIFPELVENPYQIDVTEVGNLDEFHDPHGIIQEAFLHATSIYGSDQSYYLVNGSTCGIMAAISAVCKRGDTLIVARNCHKSVYNALRLLQVKPVYIMPEWNEELNMFGGMDPDKVKRAIRQNPSAKGVMIVSPTYEGVVSDIEKIAKIAHKDKIPLLVDEAHGAHFEFMAHANETISTTDYRKVPDAAIRLGADVVIESLHKTLPAMTQCAILHYRKGLVSQKRLEEFLSIYQSTSPSYVFMATMEACIQKMDHERDGLFIIYKELLSEYRKRFAGLQCIHLVGKEDFKKQSTYEYDDGKLVFSTKDCRIEKDGESVALTGPMLGEILRTEYGQMMEMAAGDYVIAMTSIADSREAFEALYLAIETIDEQLTKTAQVVDNNNKEIKLTTLLSGRKRRKRKEETEPEEIQEYTIPEKRMEFYQARESERSMVTMQEALGRVSGDYIYVYPPGIPILAPGELFSKAVIRKIDEAVEKNLNLKGVLQKEDGTRMVEVVQDGSWLSRKRRIHDKQL